MKSIIKTFRLIHKRSDCIDFYFDSHKHLVVTTNEAMGFLISRFAAQLQYSDDSNELCEYQIDIHKIS